MGSITGLFDAFRRVNPLRGKVSPPQVSGRYVPELQSDEERDGIRHRMEAELDAQRARRSDASGLPVQAVAPESGAQITG